MTDFQHNPHGLSILLTQGGVAVAQFRAFSPAIALGIMAAMNWDRVYVHQRWSTGGSVVLENTHGWNSQHGVFVMHNGIIRSPDSFDHEVDSQAIVQWLNEGDVAYALEKLRSETFANVFMIDTRDSTYYVHRSTGGSLFTDGAGNFSTQPVCDVSRDVAAGWSAFNAATGDDIGGEVYPVELPRFLSAFDAYEGWDRSWLREDYAEIQKVIAARKKGA